MTRAELFEHIQRKQSYLCVGLDTDIEKIPEHLLSCDDPVYEFNKQIIDATKDYCVAYKPNIAFYEALGTKGWDSLQKTIAYIPDEIFTIADAKRGDINNTSTLYAKAFFETLGADSVTVAPYMGADSVTPFLQFAGKWTILLGHTSNTGSQDFQVLKTDGKPLYEAVITTSQQWATPEQLMYVVGATRTDKIAEIRYLAKEYFFLVPGVGTQGGSLKDISAMGMNKYCGLLVNSSRGIIYQSSKKDFADKARQEAHKLQQQMAHYLDTYLPK